MSTLSVITVAKFVPGWRAPAATSPRKSMAWQFWKQFWWMRDAAKYYSSTCTAVCGTP